MSILFKERHIPMIREGVKTATRRQWSEDYPRPVVGSVRGAITELFTDREDIDCWIEIEDVYQEPLGGMEEKDFEKEGMYSPREFRDIWRELYGGYDALEVVDVVEFSYVGREP